MFWQSNKKRLFKRHHPLISKRTVSVLCCAAGMLVLIGFDVHRLIWFHTAKTSLYLWQTTMMTVQKHTNQAEKIAVLTHQLDEARKRIALLQFSEESLIRVKEQNAALHQILHYKNKNHINDLHLGELVGLSDDYSKSWIMYSEDKSLNPGDFVSKNGHVIGVIDQHDGHFYTIAGIMNSNENVAVTHRKSHQSYLLRGNGNHEGLLQFVSDNANMNQGDIIDLDPIMTEEHTSLNVGVISHVEFMPQDYFVNIRVLENNHKQTSPYVTIHKRNRSFKEYL